MSICSQLEYQIQQIWLNLLSQLPASALDTLDMLSKVKGLTASKESIDQFIYLLRIQMSSKGNVSW